MGFLTIAAILSFAAVVISGVHIVRHLRNRGGKLGVRACTLIILFMVPIYAINAFSCLRHVQSDWAWPVLFTLVRELYEGVVIIAFVQLIVVWLGGPHTIAHAFQCCMQEPQHVWVSIIEAAAQGPRMHAVKSCLSETVLWRVWMPL